MNTDSYIYFNCPQTSEIQHSFSLVLELELGEIGFFPFLCFDYIERHDKRIYKLLTSYLELKVYDSYWDGFSFLGYKTVLNGKSYSLERLFQKTTGRDMWNKWVHNRTFTITGEEYYISGNTVNEYNFSIFSSFLYAYSNNKYLATLDEHDGKRTCHLYIRNIDVSNNSLGTLVEYNTRSNSKTSNTDIKTTASSMSFDNIDVFISYSRKDIQFVHSFLSMFKENAITYWIDIDGVYSGDAFKKVITKAIKASKVFLFFSSEASNNSEWTAKEINVAVRFKKEIIPILIDATDYSDEVVFDLAGLDYINYCNCSERNLLDEKLIKSIKNIIKL